MKIYLKLGQDLDLRKDRKRIKTSELVEDIVDLVFVGQVCPTYLLMDNITSGNVAGLALKAMSEKYNAIQEEITNLKVTLANIETPKISRVLTLDYFRRIKKKNSRILAQSLLVQI